MRRWLVKLFSWFGYAPRLEYRSWIPVSKFDVISSTPPPMHWAPCHESSRARYKAAFTCPNGHSMVLRGHLIATDGKVWPSVVCPRCSFHTYVFLEGWAYGDLN